MLWLTLCIMHGVANILHDVTVILRGMASILSEVPDILHVQYQFLKFMAFQREKYTFSQIFTQDFPKIWRLPSDLAKKFTQDFPKIYRKSL